MDANTFKSGRTLEGSAWLGILSLSGSVQALVGSGYGPGVLIDHISLKSAAKSL